MTGSERFAVTRIDALPEIPVSGAGIVWRPTRRTLGIGGFGVNAYTADVGETVVEEHTEERLGHEELYLVVAGRARFEHSAPLRGSASSSRRVRAGSTRRGRIWSRRSKPTRRSRSTRKRIRT